MSDSDQTQGAVAPSVEQAVESAFETAYRDAPDPTAPPTTAPSTAPQAAQPAESAPEGDAPRDAKGRFIARDDAAPEPAPSEGPPSDTPVSGDEPAPATDAAPAPDLTQYPPFEYRANGRTHNIEGAVVGSDGAFFPTAALQKLQQTLAEAHQNRDFGKEIGRVKSEAMREAQQRMQYAERLLGSLNQLRQAGPDAIANWFDELDRNWETMELKARLDLERQEKQQYLTERQEWDRQRKAAELVPRMQADVRQYITEFGKRPEMAGVDQQKMYDRLFTRFGEQLFVEQQDGQVLVNWGLIEDEMKYEGEVVRRATQTRSQSQRATTPAPPTVGAKRGPAPSSQPPIPKFKTTREADEWAFGEGMKRA